MTLVTACGGGTTHHAAPPAPSTSSTSTSPPTTPAAAPPPTSSPTPPTTTAPALVSSGVPASPVLTGIETTLNAYFSALNSHNWAAAWAQFSPSEQSSVSPAQLARGASTTTDSAIVILEVTLKSGDTAVATVNFQSNQAPADSPNDQACDRWTLDYEMISAAGPWRINGVQSGVAPYTSCSVQGHLPAAIPVLGMPWGPYQEGYGQVRPATISNGGDPTGIVSNVTWHSWGGPQAVGTGTSDYVGANQSVAAGTEETTKVVAFNIGDCQGKLMYEAVEWYYPQHGQSFSPSTYIDICTGTYVGQ
jgi:hypothetical protein